ncbi:Endoplasmic oxidoreductin [Phytophthora cinnamomi]|uniref:Endoplasmic oxidoreductin n=1 Tax=Phytophthora cinnamomi TaxID=4785 RepID=UPI00355AB364|nr:Endoplasmic oxidoreductin [Phytophthora cinnamomi]
MTGRPVSAAQVQQRLTRSWSTLRYRMEYGGYLSNHLLHGVVALFDLGASEEKIEDFADSYSTKLEEEEPSHEDVTQPDVRAKLLQDSKLTLESARALLGKRDNFDGLLALYAAEVEKLGIDGAVKKHLPGLVGGLAGALLHSIIQLGYAYHIGGGRLVAEGLAYMHYAYLSFDEPEKVNGEELVEKKQFSREEAMRLVHTLNGHEVLLGEMRQKLQSKPLIDLEIGGIQKRLNTMSGDADRGSSVAFKFIWETINSFDLSKMDGVFAIDLALWLYMMIEHNDFVILHAVTSAWALQQVEHLLEPKDRERSWKVWLHVSLSAFVTNEMKDVLASDVCDQRLNALPGVDTWARIVAKTLGLADGGLMERDLVHAYKLVQVAHDHADSSDIAFLTVEERDFIVRQSALKAISLEFGPLVINWAA